MDKFGGHSSKNVC